MKDGEIPLIYLNQLLCELRSFKQAIPCHVTSVFGQCTSTWIKLLLVKSLDFDSESEVFGFAVGYFVFAVRFLVLP